MSNVRFNLDKGYIFLIYYPSSHDRLKMSLGEKIDPSLWDTKTQRVKITHPAAAELNHLMGVIRDHIDRVRIEHKASGKRVTSSILREEITKRIYGADDIYVSHYWPRWLAEKTISPNTYKSYKNCMRRIDELYPRLRFTDINKKWYDDYLKRTTALKLNYQYKILRVFKDVIHNAYTEGVHTNAFYKATHYIIRSEVTGHVYLTMHDINNIYDHINSFDDRLRNAATIFLIGCMTGQRHQTYSKLTSSMVSIVNGTKMISVMTEKTNTRVSIPISHKLENLLSIGFKPISQQKLNTYIKEVCKAVGIEGWDQVTTHTARRTFATNAVLAGIDITYIMKITGHKTEKEFRRYVKMDDVISAQKVSDDIKLLFA